MNHHKRFRRITGQITKTLFRGSYRMQIEKYKHETERLHAKIKVDLDGEQNVDTKYLSILSGPGNFDKTRLKNIG